MSLDLNLMNNLLIFISVSFITGLLTPIYNFFKDGKFSWNMYSFLNGPYHPIAGAGAVLYYQISLIQMNVIAKIIMFMLSATLLELFFNPIFIKFFKIKIWDYSKEKYNYKGNISLLHSIEWLLLGIFFYFVLFPYKEIILNYLYIYKALFILVFIIMILESIFRIKESLKQRSSKKCEGKEICEIRDKNQGRKH